MTLCLIWCDYGDDPGAPNEWWPIELHAAYGSAAEAHARLIAELRHERALIMEADGSVTEICSETVKRVLTWECQTQR